MLSGCWGGTYSSPLLYPVSSYSVEAWYSLEVTVAEACMRCFRACVRWGEERCLLLLFTLSWPSKDPPGSWLASFSSLAVDGTQRVGEFRERVAFSWRASVVAWWCWWECEACPPWCSLDSHSDFEVVGFFFGKIVIVYCVSTDGRWCQLQVFLCGEWENVLLWPFLVQNAAQMCKTSNFEQKWRQSVTSGFYFGFYRKFLFRSIGVVSNYKKWGFESKSQRNARDLLQSLLFIFYLNDDKNNTYIIREKIIKQ